VKSQSTHGSTICCWLSMMVVGGSSILQCQQTHFWIYVTYNELFAIRHSTIGFVFSEPVMASI